MFSYVYVLALSNGRTYTGMTDDLYRRVHEHQRGNVRSTRYRDPVLIHYEAYRYKSDAQRREAFLKTTEGKRLLQQQLRDILQASR